MRGFLSGMMTGLVVAGVGLSTASLIAPQPAGNRPPEAPQVEPPEAVPGEVGTAAAEAEAPAAGGAEAPATSGVMAVDGPAVPEGEGALPVADTAPAGVPALADEAVGLGAPPAAAEDAGVAGFASEAGVAEVAAPAPVVPAPEESVEAVTESAVEGAAVAAVVEPVVDMAAVAAPVAEAVADAAPVVGDAPAPQVPEAVEPEQSQDVAAGADAPEVTGEAQPVVPEAVAEMQAPVADEAMAVEVGETALPPGDPGAEGAADAASGGGAAALVPEGDPAVDGALDASGEAEEAGGEPEAGALVAPSLEAPVVEVAPGLPGQEQEGLDLPQVGEAPEAEEGGLDLPQVGEDDGAGDLPQVGAEAEAAEEVALPGVNGEARLPGAGSGVLVNRPEAGDAAEAAGGGAAALAQYAAVWEPQGDLPLIGIVLVDDGSLAGAAAAVAALPMPVTVAVDPGSAGAAAAMAEYRAAGVEVLALARLPVGAAPTDVAVAFEAVFSLLPEAIGVIDTGSGGLQENSAVTEQAMARLAADGRGAVVPGGGLNMAARAAAAAGVPLVTVYRDIDAGGEDAAAVRRGLDQAAFRARQESGVVLVGRVRAETLSALALWGTATAAAQVDVAPVSAILLGGG
jgi:hypothetical protein